MNAPGPEGTSHPIRIGLPTGLPELVERIVTRAGGRRAVIVMDGGSGSGKTGLAAQLMHALETAGMTGLQLVHLDDVYPGWDGLSRASALVPQLLGPEDPHYWRWDWTGHHRTDRVGLDPAAPLLVEGCGALTPESAALATTTMWLAGNAASRKRAALDRDGELYAPHWDRWARQEREHWRHNHPRQLARVLLHWESQSGAD